VNIVLLLADKNKKIVEMQLVKYLRTIANNFLLPDEVSFDEYIYFLTEIILEADMKNITDALPECKDCATAEGEQVVIMLKTAVQNKFDITKLQQRCLQDELTYYRIPQEGFNNSARLSILSHLENTQIALTNFNRPHYHDFVIQTILHETVIEKTLPVCQIQIDPAFMRCNRVELLQTVLKLMESFRNNEITVVGLKLSLKLYYHAARQLPHSSYTAAAIGLFKLTGAAKSISDYWQTISKIVWSDKKVSKQDVKVPGVKPYMLAMKR
jgi:hypothetical protein